MDEICSNVMTMHSRLNFFCDSSSLREGVSYGPKWSERLAADANNPAFLGSIPASSETVENEGRQMKYYWKKYIKIYRRTISSK